MYVSHAIPAISTLLDAAFRGLVHHPPRNTPAGKSATPGAETMIPIGENIARPKSIAGAYNNPAPVAARVLPSRLNASIT